MLVQRVLAVVVGIVVALAALTGCSRAETPPSPQRVVAATPQQCAAIARQAIGAAAGELFVVTDATASRAGQRELPDAAVRTIRDAAMRREAVSVLAVDGAGAAPRWLLRHAALNYGADLADDVKKVQVAADRASSCVQAAARRAHPTRPGTDLGQAFRAVADARPRAGRVDVLAITDGVSTAGTIELAGSIAVRPAADLVADLRDAAAVPSLVHASVTIAGVGRVDGRVVPVASAQWLRSFWTSWCRTAQAHCDVPVVDQGVTGDPVAPRGLPADPLPAFPTAMRFRVAVRFAGDSSRLTDAGRAALRPVAACIATQRSGTGAIRVDGYVEPTGAAPAADLSLATGRAEAAASYLGRTTHVAPSRLRPVGHLPDAPLPDASADRRVVFVSVEGGC